MRLEFYLSARVPVTKPMTLAVTALQFLAIFNKALKLRAGLYKVRHFAVLVVTGLASKSPLIDFL